MHTIAIFKKSSEAEKAAAILDDSGVPSEIRSKEAPSDKTLFLLQAADTETEQALEYIGEKRPEGLLICDNCGSHELDFPATPNHTFLSRVAGKVAVKTHLIEEHIICGDCRNEWSP